jgi:hypothetical protein
LRRRRAGRRLPREVAHPTRFERAACGVIRDQPLGSLAW